jgi:hypothetical protein
MGEGKAVAGLVGLREPALVRFFCRAGHGE